MATKTRFLQSTEGKAKQNKVRNYKIGEILMEKISCETIHLKQKHLRKKNHLNADKCLLQSCQGLLKYATHLSVRSI